MLRDQLKDSISTALPFKYLKEHELEMLISYSRIITFSDNELVLKQGERSPGMYIIIDGKALVTVKVLGKDIINLATFEHGNFIGEVSLIEKGPCAASVIASGQLECMLITSTYFDMLALFFPETKYKITKAIAEEVSARLKILHKKIISVMTDSDMMTHSLFSEVIKSLTHPEATNFKEVHMDLAQLQESENFKSFTPEELDEFLKQIILIKAPNNCHLIKEGEKDSPLFFVVFGAVQASITHNNKVVKLAVLGPMECFTSLFYIDETPSIITYTTCERAVLLKIPIKNLTMIQKNYIQLWYKIFSLICKSFVVMERSADKLDIRLHSELYNR